MGGLDLIVGKFCDSLSCQGQVVMLVRYFLPTISSHYVFPNQGGSLFLLGFSFVLASVFAYLNFEFRPKELLLGPEECIETFAFVPA